MERRGWDEWRDNIETHIKQTASGNLLHDSGNSSWGSVTTSRDGLGWEVGGRFKRGRTYVYLCLIHADMMAKTNITL